MAYRSTHKQNVENNVNLSNELGEAQNIEREIYNLIKTTTGGQRIFLESPMLSIARNLYESI